jgi:hypothetical protein
MVPHAPAINPRVHAVAVKFEFVCPALARGSLTD